MNDSINIWIGTAAMVLAILAWGARTSIKDDPKEESETEENDSELEKVAKRFLFRSEHVLRHSISGLIVFALSVAVDIAITHRLVSKSVSSQIIVPSTEVFWSDLGPTNGFVCTELPSSNRMVALYGGRNESG